MSQWKRVKLSELGDIVGGATPSTKREEYYNGDIDWLTPKDLAGYTSRYISKGERSITEEGLKSCSAKLLPKNSVLFTSRAPIGYVAIAKNDICTNQGFKSIAPNENTDPLFLYYLLKYNKEKIESMGSGTTFKEVSGAVMKNIEVDAPDYEEQKRISAILSSIDDLIEKNDSINKNLEEQAKAIFKSWFVDFEPFQDGDFEESELGMIPKGWRVGTLHDSDIVVTDYVANGSFKSLSENVKYMSIQTENILIRLTDFNNGFCGDMVYIDKNAYDFLSKSKLYGDEIIISNVGANVGTVFRCPRLNKNMSLAPNSIMLKSNIYENYLYYYFTSTIGQAAINSIVTGSAQPKFNKTSFRSLKLILPHLDVFHDFNLIIDAIYNAMCSNVSQSKTLTNLRDSLLPKLMSGEIRVPLEVE